MKKRRQMYFFIVTELTTGPQFTTERAISNLRLPTYIIHEILDTIVHRNPVTYLFTLMIRFAYKSKKKGSFYN